MSVVNKKFERRKIRQVDTRLKVFLLYFVSLFVSLFDQTMRKLSRYKMVVQAGESDKLGNGKEKKDSLKCGSKCQHLLVDC